VTDANLVLGRLDPAYFLGGNMALDVDAAHRAVERVATQLGVPLVDAADGILDIALSGMAHAIHLVSTQRGYDVRDFTLVAFGGAGPLHANALAAELEIRRTLVPPYPGIFSALGLLVADVEHDFAVSRLSPFGALDYGSLNETFAAFAVRGRATLAQDGVPSDRMELRRTVDVRYVGQSFQLRIPVPDGDFDATSEHTVAEQFHAEHRRTYGHAAPEEPIELVNVRLTAIGHTPKPALRVPLPQEGPLSTAVRSHRSVYFAGSSFVDCEVYDRQLLGAGARLLGPAIVDEFDSTTVVFPGYAAEVDQHGNLVVQQAPSA
jgi:N-methylhydantoinase A